MIKNLAKMASLNAKVSNWKEDPTLNSEPSDEFKADMQRMLELDMLVVCDSRRERVKPPEQVAANNMWQDGWFGIDKPRV